jgi:hypothetical protein
MTSFNDCELVRVFVRSATPGSAIADDTIKHDQPFQLVVQAEAGDAIYGNGGPYRFAAVVTDLHNPATPVATPNLSGTFRDAHWNSPAIEIVLATLPAQGPTKDDHIYRATVVMVVGQANPIVDFAESNPFAITQP